MISQFKLPGTLVLAVVLGTLAGFDACAQTRQTLKEQATYEHRAGHSLDGTGKFYHGREIALVMGHPGAGWLERPERETEEKPALLLKALDLKPGMVVADIGAGTGYYSWRMAGKVKPGGKVFGVDIQPEMLRLLATNMAARKLTNVVGVLGGIKDPNLPEASVDLALFVDVYHELEYPREMMEAVCRSLKPEGRVVLVEYRAEDITVPIKKLHKMSEAQVRKEMTGLPLEWVTTRTNLPWQHVLVFRKTR